MKKKPAKHYHPDSTLFIVIQLLSQIVITIMCILQLIFKMFSWYTINGFCQIEGEYFLNHVFAFMENLLLFYYSSCLDTIIMGVMNDIHQNT